MRRQLDFLICVGCWWAYDVMVRWSRRFRSWACDAQNRRLGRFWPPDDSEAPF